MFIVGIGPFIPTENGRFNPSLNGHFHPTRTAVLSNEILQIKDVFIPVNHLQQEQKAGEAEQRLDKAYDLLSGLNDFEISVIQDSDNQIICMELAEDPAGNPSVYIDFLHNVVRAEQDGIRISEQTLPQIYRNAIGAIGTYIWKEPCA